jgi:hypothetical protein|tara:strand:+ start:1649 stop:1822 length:174 start_codon:yes stop_codon:yes gene_type:complete
MARQSSTEVKLQFICEKISKLEKGQDELFSQINRGKGAVWVLLIVAGLVSGFYNYFK